MIWSSLLAAQGLCSKPSLNNSCWLNSFQGLLPDTFRKYGHLTTLSHFLSLSSFLPPPCPRLIFFLFSISLFFSFFFFLSLFFFSFSFFVVVCFLTCANYLSPICRYWQVSALWPRCLQPYPFGACSSPLTLPAVGSVFSCEKLWAQLPPPILPLQPLSPFFPFLSLPLLLSQLPSRARKQEEETQQNMITS